MSIFRDLKNKQGDRSAQDRKRHKELIREKLKEGVGDVIADESIIGRSKDKKVKIPIKGIKEYQFVYGSNKGMAQGEGADDGKPKAGSTPGEDIYETEITIEELVNLMFEDLKLPDLERKKFSYVETTKSTKRLGYRIKGPRNKLAIKKSLINKIKRKQSTKRSDPQFDENEHFPFHEDDLRYRRHREDIEYESNAVIFCIMDVSGSMDTMKKYLARSFYFLLYQFLNTKYEHVDIVFIAHHTEANEVTEDDFFHRMESGGTFISSGYRKTLDIINERYSSELWNIYAFHCSDGDNWSEDDEKAVALAKELTEISNLFGYCEIKPNTSWSWSSMLKKYQEGILHSNFISITIRDKTDIFPAMKKILNKESEHNTIE